MGHWKISTGKLALMAGICLSSTGCWLIYGAGHEEIANSSAQNQFLKSAAYSYLPGRSGDLFILPKKYNYMAFDSGDYAHDGVSHLMKDGQIVKLKSHKGSTHSTPWDYDVDIPVVMYGSTYVKSGAVFERDVTLQDIVPTYARLLHTEAPEDAVHGQALTEALQSGSGIPRVILTLVIDQGGQQYYRAHPNAHPHIDRYRQLGSYYPNGHVTHLDVETAVGHTAIGTGAYPYQHGIMANQFYIKPLGTRANFTLLGGEVVPAFINSPTLADTWDRLQDNRPIVFSYAYAQRAALGMAGHGALYKGGDKDIVLYYNNKTGQPTTNPQYYHLPEYLKNMTIRPYLDKLLAPSGLWWDHDVNNFSDVNRTPAQAWFDTDLFFKVLENEPIGQDSVTDLMYMTLKSTDACAHGFGWESLECGEVFTEQDKMVKRIIDALEQKVGKEHILVTITADHGGAPLPELSNGKRIKALPMKAAMNQALDKVDNGVDLIQDITATQLYANDNELQRNQLTWQDLKDFVLNYEIDGQTVFETVLLKDDILKEQLELELTAY